MKDGADELAWQLTAAGFKDFVREYKFCPTRRWRLDLADLCRLLAIEVEGGIWTGGRHVRGSGFTKDIDKYNELAILGWRLLRFTPDQVRVGVALQCIKRALRAH